ncbi:MAG: class I SAM-dependent methyltransferase [Gemmatimonadota bacterium]|nr:MAG: class I SAM-dependent methyltransferase [Gemmatimonadota bacterium]
MFQELEEINRRPAPFECYTASDLWTDDHTSAKMLAYHLNDEIDVSSRNSAFIDKSVEWISSRFRVGEGKKIADFGCGPGLYASRLAQRNATVTGVDFSARSINYAEDVAAEQGLTVRYVNQNYLEYETDHRFDLILMIMCDYCALSPQQRRTMLAKFRTLLEPGGSILLDVYSLAGFDEREETAGCEENLLDGFWSAHKYYGFSNTFKYEDEKVILDKYTIVESSRTRTVYNWLQYFSTESLKAEFEENGLEVEEFMGDVAGAPFDSSAQEFAVIARKG